ncbi:ATP-binding protein [Actinocrispum sp. NPDC049592]|uniref:ATP-binding protein n=1 Tax=Actinocrispum sp. NPDC049592 TaxID=3154835 RepID=UPI0034323E42
METEEDEESLPPLPEWAGALPTFAADVVTDADLTAPHLYVAVRAEPSRLATVRSLLSRWADDLGVPPEEREDLVMAVEEAVSNTIKHAEPGAVALFAARDNLARAVHVIVKDGGPWRTPTDDSVRHGRGLRMMDGLADVLDVHHDDTGTTVVLRWALPSNA